MPYKGAFNQFLHVRKTQESTQLPGEGKGKISRKVKKLFGRNANKEQLRT